MLLGYNLIMMSAVCIGMPFFMILLFKQRRRAAFRHRMGWTIKRQLKSIDCIHSRQPIWIHALSVGEVVSAQPLVDHMKHRFPDHPLVLSTSTQTGFETAARMFAAQVECVFYYPYDFLWSVKRVVRYVNPLLVIVVETDIWPNFLLHLKRRGIPALLVNARLSQSSYRGYRMLGASIRQVLTCFTWIGVQTPADANRFIRLGVPEESVVVTGNIKFDQKCSCDPLAEAFSLRRLMGLDPNRKIILLGSTHPGEESAMLSAYLRLKQKFSDLMLIVVPRDTERAVAIEKEARAQGLTGKILSTWTFDKLNDSCDFLVIGAIGMLRSLYALADIAFVGGSLVREGGHNPLEAACYAKPILFGPDMSDFADIADKLERAGAAFSIKDSAVFYNKAEELIRDDRLRKQMGDRALQVFLTNSGAVQKTMNMITLIN